MWGDNRRTRRGSASENTRPQKKQTKQRTAKSHGLVLGAHAPAVSTSRTARPPHVHSTATASLVRPGVGPVNALSSRSTALSREDLPVDAGGCRAGERRQEQPRGGVRRGDTQTRNEPSYVLLCTSTRVDDGWREGWLSEKQPDCHLSFFFFGSRSFLSDEHLVGRSPKNTNIPERQE